MFEIFLYFYTIRKISGFFSILCLLQCNNNKRNPLALEKIIFLHYLWKLSANPCSLYFVTHSQNNFHWEKYRTIHITKLNGNQRYLLFSLQCSSDQKSTFYINNKFHLNLKRSLINDFKCTIMCNISIFMSLKDWVVYITNFELKIVKCMNTNYKYIWTFTDEYITRKHYILSV